MDNLKEDNVMIEMCDLAGIPIEESGEGEIVVKEEMNQEDVNFGKALGHLFLSSEYFSRARSREFSREVEGLIKKFSRFMEGGNENFKDAILDIARKVEKNNR